MKNLIILFSHKITSVKCELIPIKFIWASQNLLFFRKFVAIFAFEVKSTCKHFVFSVLLPTHNKYSITVDKINIVLLKWAKAKFYTPNKCCISFRPNNQIRKKGIIPSYATHTVFPGRARANRKLLKIISPQRS